jgi:hypothetical protein
VLLGGGEAVIPRLDVLHESTRALPVQRAVEDLLRILQGTATVRELVSN